MSNIAGWHAVVTGGGSGIGAATAAALAAGGARVTVMGRNESRLDAVAADIGAAYRVVDVTDRDGVQRIFADVADREGDIDVLVNNAGMAEAAPFAKQAPADWDRTLAVNLTGTYHCVRAAVGGMLDRRFGRIVNIASTAALTGYPYVAAYCAAKHGVLGLTRSLALEYARKGITVNAVCPGYTDTDIVARAIDGIVASTGRTRDEALEELVSVNPQRRLVRPEEVAETVVWLCAQASVNGQAIAVDGGEVQ